jgi:hypothetical protein
MVNEILANPPLNATGSEPQIIQQLAVLSVNCDFMRRTAWASPAPRSIECFVHGQNQTTALALISSSGSPDPRI